MFLNYYGTRDHITKFSGANCHRLAQLVNKSLGCVFTKYIQASQRTARGKSKDFTLRSILIKRYTHRHMMKNCQNLHDEKPLESTNIHSQYLCWSEPNFQKHLKNRHRPYIQKYLQIGSFFHVLTNLSRLSTSFSNNALKR